MFSLVPRLIAMTQRRALGVRALPLLEGPRPRAKSSVVFPVHDMDELTEEVRESDTPVIVNFSVSWLKQSRALTTNIESEVVAKQGEIKLAQVDMDGDEDFFETYGINEIPCLIAFNNGIEVDRVTGLQCKSTLRGWLDHVMKEAGYGN